MGLSKGSVIDAHFGIESDGCCGDYSSAGIWIYHNIPLIGKQRKLRQDYTFINLEGESIISIIEEILEK